MDLDSSNSEKSQLIIDENKVNEERCSPCFRFPKAIYFIVIIELCERFNFYGMKTILILYLTQHLLMSDGNAMSVYHLFVSLCYITTIIGSFIADNYLGKYKTLVIIGVIYSIGSVLMSLTSIPAINLSGPIISLILIAFGTGGVKACVSPFGGDQIPSDQKIVLDSFFSAFYFAINLGALLSTILTPILRANVACNGSSDCYPLAFGVPAILMVAALIILLAGRKLYIEVPVNDSIYIRSLKCIILAIKTWIYERHTDPKNSLLDYAEKEYNASFINDLRRIYRLSILFLPLPVYWALFDQMGSRWTLQASQLDGDIGLNIFILPDQMNLFNVIMIISLIPIFDNCIYPLSYRIDPVLRPLRKMTVGIAFTSLSFVVAFILQNKIEALQSIAINPSNARFNLINGLPCDMSLTLWDGRNINIGSYQLSQKFLDLVSGSQLVHLTFTKCIGRENFANIVKTVMLYPGQYNFLVAEMDSSNNVNIRLFYDFQKPNINGNPLISLVAAGDAFDKFQFILKQAVNGNIEKLYTVNSNQSLYRSNWETLINPGRYVWSVKVPTTLNTTSKWLGVLVSDGTSLVVEPIKITTLEVSLFYMTRSNIDNTVIVIPVILNNGGRISILWQIPQYFLISVGEILFSITGLSFSYDQAPNGMKALVNAMWFITVAVGNILVFIIAQVHMVEKQSWEFLIFAILCMVFCAIFAIIACFYKMNEDIKENYSMEVKSSDDLK